MVTFRHKRLLPWSSGRRGGHLCGVPSPLVCGIPASVDPFGVGVLPPGNAFEFQCLLHDGFFQGSSQSKGKSSDKGQTFGHPLVEALVRVDPLAGALALGACLAEGELASSPVEKALGSSGLGPFGRPKPFFPVGSAKLLSVSCAGKEKRLRQ